VQVLLELADSQIEVSVIDTGEGISPEFLPYIFDRFKQADPSITRRHRGLGIGLAIVKQLVELHGGSIRAKSAGIGKGATFTVSLPLMVLDLPLDGGTRQHSWSRPQAMPLPPAISLEKVTVLVIDDEPDARNLLRQFLESAGAAVYLAASAKDGIELLLTKPINVLVCDIGMPDEDGYSLIRRIRALSDGPKSQIAAVALTAYARPQDRVEAIRSGFQVHLPKPVESVQLLTAINSLLNHNHRSKRQSR
jgi:CheY-like chemotaxis protein